MLQLGDNGAQTAPLESVISDPTSDENHNQGSSLKVEGSIGDEASGALNEKWLERKRQRLVLERLRAWHRQKQDRYKSLLNFLSQTLRFSRQMLLPHNDELLALANHYFPPMDRREVTIYELEPARERLGSWKHRCSSLLYLPQCETIHPTFNNIFANSADFSEVFDPKPNSVLLRWM